MHKTGVTGPINNYTALPKKAKRPLSAEELRVAIGRSIEAGKQLQEKRGPIYEAWKAGLRRALERAP